MGSLGTAVYPSFTLKGGSSLSASVEGVGMLGTRVPLLESAFYASRGSFVAPSESYVPDSNQFSHENHGEKVTRSSLLFESSGPVVVPLSESQDALAKKINFFKKWYLLMHVLYILLLSLIGSLLFYVIEGNLKYIDAFFIATSCVCCCGLQTVDVETWKLSSNLLRHFLMIGGSMVVTSANQPLLRLWILKRMWPVFERHPEDSFREKALRASRYIYAERLWYTSVICVFTPLIYFCFVNLTLMILLIAFNQSNLTFLDVFQVTIAAFQSSVFVPLGMYVEDFAVVLVVTIACALGFTFFPVVLRGFFYVEWFVYRLMRRIFKKIKLMWMRKRNNTVGTDISEESLRALNASFYRTESLLVDRDLWGEAVFLCPWDRGFYDILRSQEPVVFNTFLFVRSETIYLCAAWWTITLAQAVPFWTQQWSGDGVLAPFSTSYKIFLSVCQAALVRFAGVSFLPLLKYSNAHVFLTIFCMFLPALPIPTDRTYRKWKQILRTSMVRLLTSRLFWLFAAVLSILFLEGDWLSEELVGTRFDIGTRVLFEVISAFSNCGLSLSLTGSVISFVGSFGVISKLIIILVIVGGRHRTVDMGIDLGFAMLQGE